MNASDYERVTGEIANSVFARPEGSPCLNVKIGNKSKWQGQSGFVHQIDVAIEGDTDIIMIECKHWKNRCIKAEHLLTFIARIADIRPVVQKKIHPVVVTPHKFQSGCHKLGRFYDVDLEIISSAGNFAFEYKGIRFVGIQPQAGASHIQGYAPTVLVSS
jgi:hypothetical protein